ncbi:MAG TPA: hypothetical protein VJX92_18055 [Methylomirabilota bacterium]|nr:hypothetical protein [Methylomirabilota bacterium]
MGRYWLGIDIGGTFTDFAEVRLRADGRVAALPLPYRAYVRRALYARLTALATLRPVSRADLPTQWEELAAAAGLGSAPGRTTPGKEGRS